MTIKRLKIALAVLFIITVFLGASSVRADDTTIKTLDVWKIINNVIQPRNASSTLKVPTLGGSGTKCLHTNNSGNISTSTADCGSGSGGTFTTTTFNGLSSTAYTILPGTNVTISTSSPGTLTINSTSGGGTPGGTSTQIQFNDNGSFGGASDLTWTKNGSWFTISSSSVSSSILQDPSLTALGPTLVITDKPATYNNSNTNNGAYIQFITNSTSTPSAQRAEFNGTASTSYFDLSVEGNGHPILELNDTPNNIDTFLTTQDIERNSDIYTFPVGLSGTFCLTNSCLTNAASSTFLWRSNNLSDLISSSSARTNIGFSAGTGLTLSSLGVFNNNGVLSLNGATGTITGLNIYNTTTTLSAGPGITVSNGGIGATTVTNNGVLSLTAGGNILISSASGTPVIAWNASVATSTITTVTSTTICFSGDTCRTTWPIGSSNTTTTLNGLNGAITFSTTTSGASFTITSSSQNIAFNFPFKLNTINGFATTTGGLIVATSSVNGWALVPVGTNGKALVASSTAANGISWESIVNSLTGTANQITFTAGTGNLTASLPQNIDTAANVQFGSVTSTQLKTTATSTLAATNGFVAIGTSTLVYPFTVGDNLNGTNAYIALSPTSTAGINNLFQIKGSHIVATGTVPTASSCGSGPAIVGTDMAGTLTVGTGVVSSCTVTFAAQWVNPPACSVASNAAIASQTLAITTSTFIVGGTSVSGDIIPYICLGNEP